MPVVPTPPTFVDGLLVTSQMNQLGDALRFSQKPPIVQLRQSAVQTLTTGISAAITFTAEVVDSDVDGVGGHDNSTDPSRYTVRYPGYYEFAGGVSFVNNATGIRLVTWMVNGVTVTYGDQLDGAVTGNTTRLAARTIVVYMNIGDYIELWALQTSGGNLNTSVGSGEQSSLSGRWLSNA